MRSVNDELDLHRLTVDEAIPKLDQFLNAAFRGGLYRVRIIHGKGTGVLRQEVSRYLSGHPLVKSHNPADRFHGGIGATEVELSEW
ncbi:MAG: Smr/MutS family protein [Dehalococcoidales bacterium]|nr:Smr/MutS family protein [Dehalococcoidales bacterium]